MGATASSPRSITVANATFDLTYKREPELTSDGECGSDDNFLPQMDDYWKKRLENLSAAHAAAEAEMLKERKKARYEVKYRMRRYEHDKVICMPETAALAACYSKSSTNSGTLNCSKPLDILISCLNAKRRQRLDEEDECSRLCAPKHWPL